MSEGRATERIGVVDIGSNSVKLLVLDGNDTLHRDSVVTRLGTGVADSGNLSETSIDDTLRRLGEIRAILDSHVVTDVHAVATAAVRSAGNSSPFIEAASRVLGCPVTVIDGVTEGSLAFIGAQRNLEHVLGTSPITVIDIGGGSTEFSIGAPGTTPRVVSIPFGVLNAIGDVHDAFDEACLVDSRLASPGTVVGCAGTIVTAAAVEVGLIDVDPLVVADRLDGFFLEREAAEDVFRTLATERLADRVHNPGLPRDRADVIVGGLCVLVALLRRWDAPGMLVSTRGILDGVCAEISGRT